MITIVEALKLPDQCPVEQIQGRISKVYEHIIINTKYGEKPKQNFAFGDGAGNKMEGEVWGHADLKGTYEGKEVVIRQGKPGKGLKVKHDSYDKNGETIKSIILEVSSAGQFQIVSGAPAAPQPQAKAPSEPSAAPQAQSPQPATKTSGTAINGAKVGMALNNAVLLLTNQGNVNPSMEVIAKVASQIIRLSNWLEEGNLVPEDPKSTAIKEPVKEDEIPF
jgi:hypothetical protein